MKAHRQTNRVRLGVQSLEARDVPATIINLTSTGAQGVANGALLRQSEPVAQAGQFNSYLALKDNGNEAGYNTHARPFQMDQVGGLGATHALRLNQVPTVVVNGVTYREFLVDVKQKVNDPIVSLTELRVFTGNNRFLTGYNGNTNTLGGKSAVFNLDQGGDVTVRLNGNLNSGPRRGDAVVLIPNSVFGDQQYVFMFARFTGANGGAEAFGVRPVAVAPPPPPPTGGSLSGTVFADINTNGNWDTEATGVDQEYAMSGVTVELYSLDAEGNSTFLTTATTSGTGDYTFGNLAAGTYFIVVLHPETFQAGTVADYTVDLPTGANLTGYNFGEWPDSGS